MALLTPEATAAAALTLVLQNEPAMRAYAETVPGLPLTAEEQAAAASAPAAEAALKKVLRRGATASAAARLAAAFGKRDMAAAAAPPHALREPALAQARAATEVACIVAATQYPPLMRAAEPFYVANICADALDADTPPLPPGKQARERRHRSRSPQWLRGITQRGAGRLAHQGAAAAVHLRVRRDPDALSHNVALIRPRARAGG